MKYEKKQMNCYIDTTEGWKFLNSKFKDYKKVILTSSPEILLNKSINLKKIEVDKVVSSKFTKFCKGIGKISNDTFYNARNLNYSHNFSTHLSTFVQHFQKYIRAAIPLKKEFFFQSNLIVNVETKKNLYNQNLENIYLKIFKDQNNLIVKKIRLRDEKFYSTLLSPSLFLRLVSLGRVNVEFLFWRYFWKLFRKFSTKGIFLVGVDGFFVRETLIHLSRKGYGFVELRRPKIKLSNINKKRLKESIKITMHVKHFLSKWLNSYIAKKMYNIFLEELSIFLRKFEYNQRYWKNFLLHFPKGSIKGFISTHCQPHAFHGISDYFINKKIPIFNFQHGHGKEISNRHVTYYKLYAIATETIGDKIFTYNKQSEYISNKNPLKRGSFEAIGTPKIYRKRKKFFLNSNYKILFVSTTLCRGMNTGNPTHKSSEETKNVSFDLMFIDRVLKKVNKRVLYKTYPLYGNLSDEIIAEKLSNVRNIKLIKKNYDLGYFLNKKRIIITSKSTGTLGSCILSDMPLVFIDLKKYDALKKKMLRHVKESLFYFDSTDKFFFIKLKNFLNLPLKKIYDKWEQKKLKREKLIKNFFSINTNTAGEEACTKILEYNNLS